MNKLVIALLITTSNIALSTGYDGSSGEEITSEPTEVFCFKTGTSGTNGEKTGSDGSSGNKGETVCVLKEKA